MACAWNQESAKNIVASQGAGGGNGGAMMRQKGSNKSAKRKANTQK